MTDNVRPHTRKVHHLYFKAENTEPKSFENDKLYTKMKSDIHHNMALALSPKMRMQRT